MINKKTNSYLFARQAIESSINLNDTQKKELVHNLNTALNFSKSASVEEIGKVSAKTKKVNTLGEIEPEEGMRAITIKNKHRHAELTKRDYEYKDSYWMTDENLNLGVRCDNRREEGIAPIIPTANKETNARLRTAFADSTTGDSIGLGPDTPIYGEQQPGVQDFETFFMDPQIIRQQFVPGVTQEIIKARKVYPNISLTVVMFNTLQYAADFRPYNSLSRDGLSNFTRQIMKAYFFKFMGNVFMEGMDQAAWSQAKINAFAERQHARERGWKSWLNSILRFGWRDAAGRIVITGIDNAVGRLPTLIATPNQAGSPYADPSNRGYLQFLQDFITIFAEIQTRTNMLKLGANRDQLLYEGEVELVIFPKLIVYLAGAMNPTTSTESALDWLLKTMPNLKLVLDPLLNATATEAGSQDKWIWTPTDRPQGYRMQLILHNEERFGCPTLLETSLSPVKSFKPIQVGDDGWNYKNMYTVGSVMMFVPANVIDFEYLVNQTAIESYYRTKNTKLDYNDEIANYLEAYVKESKEEEELQNKENERLAQEAAQAEIARNNAIAEIVASKLNKEKSNETIKGDK